VDTIGDDFFTLFFKNLTSGTTLPETIPSVYYSVEWGGSKKLPHLLIFSDASTVFYNTIDEEKKQSLKAFRHVIGTNPSQGIPPFEIDIEVFVRCLCPQ
jgi:protease II